jgi:hypothetical protein
VALAALKGDKRIQASEAVVDGLEEQPEDNRDSHVVDASHGADRSDCFQ